MRKIYLGTMGWSYRFWELYPRGTAPEGFLEEYAKHFNTVEINSTFYRIPGEVVVKRWSDQTPDDFVFAAKFPRVITHVKMLEGCEAEKEIFIKRISLLGHKLGPLLLQFPPGFGPGGFDALSDFLSGLPQGYRYAVEVRNKKWPVERLVSLLTDRGAALVLTDSPRMPEPHRITADFIYIRWEGDRKTVDGTKGKVEQNKSDEIKKWAEKIRGFPEESEVFGYFSKTFSGYPPLDVKLLLDQL